jgi:OOP family OmpA-OmpF porin
MLTISAFCGMDRGLGRIPFPRQNGEPKMRASLIHSLGAAALTTISATFIVPAHADPAYTADKLIAVFLQDKEAVEAAKTDKLTRKIRLRTDAETAPPPSTVPSAPVHHVDLLVKFEFDSNKLTSEAKENLTQAATALQDPRFKGFNFEIAGHTDATGTEQYNLGLSERRANAVAAYLISLGVEPSALHPQGFGKTKPRVPDPYSPENRRVEATLAE